MSHSADPMSTGSDVNQLKDLVSWATERGLSLSAVQVGACRIEIAPSAPIAGAAAIPQRVDPRLDGIYQQFGAEIWDDVSKSLNLPAGLEPAVRVK